MENKMELHRPVWKRYTLIKYKGKEEISRERVWVDEAKIFPTAPAEIPEHKTESDELAA